MSRIPNEGLKGDEEHQVIRLKAGLNEQNPERGIELERWLEQIKSGKV